MTSSAGKMALAILAASVLVALAGGTAAPASAETYPDRMIKIVVPFTPGGPVDLVARLVAQRMAPALGQSVVIENRAGAGGVIGVKAVVNAEPDGYTLLFGNVSTLAVIPAVTHNRECRWPRCRTARSCWSSIRPCRCAPSASLSLTPRRGRAPSTTGHPAMATPPICRPSGSSRRPASTSCTCPTRAWRMP